MAKRSRKRSASRVDRRDLAPLVAEGFTEGVPLDRVEQELPPQAAQVDPSHLNAQETISGTRVPVPRFYAEDDAGAIWTPQRGRSARHVRVTVLPETLDAIKAGWICLRCLEPQDEPFPAVCQSPPEMGCTYPIAERQRRDIAVEYEGERQLGPERSE